MKIVKTLFLKAPREHVWKFLTEPAKLALWFHEGEGELREGGVYALLTNSLGKEGERICWGKVLEMRSPERLVHTFQHDFLNGAETTCEWTLEAVEGGSILTLTHSGFETARERAFHVAGDHDKGWDEHFIRLRRIVA